MRCPEQAGLPVLPRVGTSQLSPKGPCPAPLGSTSEQRSRAGLSLDPWPHSQPAGVGMREGIGGEGQGLQLGLARLAGTSSAVDPPGSEGFPVPTSRGQQDCARVVYGPDDCIDNGDTVGPRPCHCALWAQQSPFPGSVPAGGSGHWQGMGWAGCHQLSQRRLVAASAPVSALLPAPGQTAGVPVRPWEGLKKGQCKVGAACCLGSPRQGTPSELTTLGTGWQSKAVSAGDLPAELLAEDSGGYETHPSFAPKTCPQGSGTPESTALCCSDLMEDGLAILHSMASAGPTSAHHPGLGQPRASSSVSDPSRMLAGHGSGLGRGTSQEMLSATHCHSQRTPGSDQAGAIPDSLMASSGPASTQNTSPTAVVHQPQVTGPTCQQGKGRPGLAHRRCLSL